MRSLILLGILFLLLCAPAPRAGEPANPAPGPRIFTVRVLAEGRPVVAASIYAQDPIGTAPVPGHEPAVPVLSDARGEARVTLKEHRALVLVLAPGFAPQQKVIALKDPAEPLVITLDRGQPCRLRVVSRETRHPVPDTPVFFGTLPSVHDFYVLKLKTQPVIGVTNADGFLTWTNAPRGIVFVQVPNSIGSLPSFHWDCVLEPEKVAAIRTE